MIKNKINGKLYIGQTIRQDINDRWRQHKSFKKDTIGNYLYNAYKKYGLNNFEYKLICICFDEDCKNSKVIRDVVSCLDWEGLSYSDAHRGNFGYVRRNKRWIPIVIDVGIESFDDWDSDVYGHFDHDTCEMEREIYG
jgi:hypothetical protein